MKRSKVFMTIILVLVAIFISSSMMITVNAEEPSQQFIVDELHGKGTLSIIKFKHSDEQVFCIDRKIAHPSENTVYELGATPDDVNLETLQKVFYVIEKHKVDNLEFRGAAQIFLWSATENIAMKNWIQLYIGTDNAMTYYETMLNDFDTLTEFDKYDIQFYYSEGYQRLAGYTVSKFEDEKPINPPIDETEPTLPPDEEPSVPDSDTSSDTEEQPTPDDTEPIEPEILPSEPPYYPEAPQTSDNSNVMLYVILLITSLIGIVALSLWNRKS